LKSLVLFLALVVLGSGAALALTPVTPVLDGDIGPDWGPDSFFDIVFIPDTAGVDIPYQLHLTWDSEFFWVGLNSEAGRYYLQDGNPNISFFVAIDVDQTFGSGAPTDGYGNVNFYGCHMPEYVFYFAGGAGWYEWGYWDGAAWDWRGWRNDNTFYAWDGGDVYDDELGILWSDIGNPQGIAVMAWITFDETFGAEPGVLAAYPIQNPTGVLPTFMWAYPFFMPHVPGPMPVMGFIENSVAATNGEFSATQPSSWGAVKALYR
jgi:hypothetical protein